MILARGIFQASANARIYNDHFYDSIKSINENKSIKARIPATLRSKLENGQAYLFKGYVEKKIAFSTIELVLVVDEVLQKEEHGLSAEDEKRVALLQKKIARGYRDFEALVKEHVYRGEPIKLLNIYGLGAIVHKDFEKGLGEARTRFQIEEHRCNFNSRKEIIQSLRGFSGTKVHAIALVRGGGDAASLDIFNDPAVAEAGIDLQPLFITALGHTVNESVCDKIADRKFALPHDYGCSLKQWVDNAVEEQAKSKSVFIEQVRTELKKTYQDQISLLRTQAERNAKELKETRDNFTTLLEQAQKERTENAATQANVFRTQLEGLTQLLKIREETEATLTRKIDQLEKKRKESEYRISRLKTTRDIILLIALCIMVLAAALIFT